MNPSWALRVGAIAFTVLVLHLGVAPNLRLAGVAAELPIGLAIASGLAGGVERGAIFGFFFGFVVDLFLFTPIGLSALVFGVAGWVAGHVFMDRIEESALVAALAIGVGTAAAMLAFVGLGLALGESSLLEAPVGRIILLSSLMNAVAAFVLMFLAHWMWAVDPLGDRRFRL
ncbi:MAG: rod shape-determining protein MreD [Actinomycetota bacterium]